MNDSQLEAICDKVKVENFPINSMVFNENNIRQNLFLIYEGEVELFKRTPYGGEKDYQYSANTILLAKAH